MNADLVDSAQGSTPVSFASSQAVPGLQERNPRDRLRRDDTFDLDLALSPEFNQTVAVQPDGYVTLKAVGTIFVEKQTVPELTETKSWTPSKGKVERQRFV